MSVFCQVPDSSLVDSVVVGTFRISPKLDAAANVSVQFVRFKQVQKHLLLSVELSEMRMREVAVIL